MISAPPVKQSKYGIHNTDPNFSIQVVLVTATPIYKQFGWLSSRLQLAPDRNFSPPSGHFCAAHTRWCRRMPKHRVCRSPF